MSFDPFTSGGQLSFVVRHKDRAVGASVIYGYRLFKDRVLYSDGTEGNELRAEQGDWVNMSYSSVDRMVEFCASREVSEDDWPIYYGVWQGDVDLADVAARCKRLHQALARLGESEGAEITWLASVREWLNSGKQFVVLE